MAQERNVKFNYSYMRGFIRENFKTYGNYAKFLGISVTTLYDRLNGKVPFNQIDIYRTANFALDRKLTEEEVNLIFFNF